MTRQQSLLIWLVTAAIAIGAAALTRPASYYDGEVVPVGNDSFYHARRILDAVKDPAGFYEFDPRIHAPEGSLLPWPWGYDYGMALLARAGIALGLSDNPMEVLAWIPVASVVLSMAFLLLICRELGLSRWTTMLAGLCMALAPTTQMLHGVGVIDHHYAEMICALAALALGLRWLRDPDDWRRACMLGVLLGIAPAIHNGLFILQLPILGVLVARWLQGIRLSTRAHVVLAASLMVATVAILLPSQSFQLRRFEFYTLSWFHLYIAASTAAVIVFVGRMTYSRLNVALLATLGLLLLIPIVGQIRHGQSFLAGSIKYLDAISEMRPPLKAAMTVGPILISRTYSLLFWASPLVALLCLWGCWRDRANPRLIFWATSLFGLALLWTQLRLHYFGDFALYVPWLVVVEHWTLRKPEFRKKILLAVTTLLLLAYAPALRYQIAGPLLIANDDSFPYLRPVLGELQQACATDPGIVLADNNMAHYITYYTDCSVIADNFLLTPQHFAKLEEMRQLLSLPAAELEQRAPLLRYVIVRAAAVEMNEKGKVRFRFWFDGNSRLANDLLFDAVERVPSNFTMLHEVRFKRMSNVPYAKLYRIGPKTKPSVKTATK